jgi:2-amino-4-hydroxy-6-hydroxymethyldihydropteridine diphosphokinase
VTAALSLGANLGDPETQIGAAIAGLRSAFESLLAAPLFRTEPISAVDQADYLNTAVVGATALAPEELLGLAKALELAAGRRRAERFGPRPLDIDLLLYGDLFQRSPELSVPHPRLAERRFYLEPLARIAPELRVPPTGVTVAELLRAGTTAGAVIEVAWAIAP